jgi:hypothetical protein
MWSVVDRLFAPQGMPIVELVLTADESDALASDPEFRTIPVDTFSAARGMASRRRRLS